MNKNVADMRKPGTLYQNFKGLQLEAFKLIQIFAQVL